MFETLLVQPIYNGFMLLIGIMPQGDVGLAIVALTVLLRAIFYPAFTSQIRTQIGMQVIQPQLDEINKKYKDQPEERTRRTMALFKENKVRPFSGFLVLLIQLPVFLALYIAFFREGLPSINHALLYPFVMAPSTVSANFFGILDLLSSHNIFLTVLVALTQYAAIRLTLARTTPAPGASPERAAAQAMQRNLMLYMMPALMGIISYSFPAAVGLYFITSNLISLLQEWVVKHQIRPMAA
jgi:YidC/Oxa1 family membrane protein insertase